MCEPLQLSNPQLWMQRFGREVHLTQAGNTLSGGGSLFWESVVQDDPGLDYQRGAKTIH